MRLQEMGWPEMLLIFFTTFPLLGFPAISVGSMNTESHFFDFFDQSNANSFTFQSTAGENRGALQITGDSRNNNYAVTNQSGRVMYNTPFKLWERTPTNSTTLASFTSIFEMNVYRFPDTIPGEGIAFIIAPDLTIPAFSHGQWLSLTNSSTDSHPANRLVAIEFDTYKQSFDPSDNHVGININSVVSENTFNLSLVGIEIAPEEPKNYTVWVDFSGDSHLLEVFILNQGGAKPSNSVINMTIDLSDYLNQKSYFGFSASTGIYSELNCVLKWNLTVEILPEDRDRKWVLLVAIVVPSSSLLITAGVAVGLYIHRQKVSDDPKILGALQSLPGTPREFRFSDLKKATNNFDEKSKLGQGGFGVVYKGVLPRENITVAVKKFSREAMKGRDDFLAELTIINRLRHKNLVRLLGWCHRKGVLLIVYEYMPNGSLDAHLFGSSPHSLSWEQRYNIITDVASALHYLHNEYDDKVVHRDLKASNVLLDSDFNARLGDFGLARVLGSEQTSYAELHSIPGTVGYIAPECLHGKATRQSDVYGFGAVVLEVVCGCRPWVRNSGYLVDWVWALYREGQVVEAVDEHLKGNFEEEDAKRLLLLGLACSHPIPSERPKVQQIVQIISRSVDPPFVPAFRPPFVWNMGSKNDNCSSDAVTASTSLQTSTGYYYGSGWNEPGTVGSVA